MMARFASRVFAFSLFAGSLTLLPATTASAAGYRLQPGDTIEFMLLGTEALKARATVDLDGNVRLPLGKTFKAGDKTVDELRDEIASALRDVTLPAGTDQAGNTLWNSIYSEGVIVSIAEYRPIYVSGDILTPGAQAFRFGITARQAITAAGGYSRFRSRQDRTLELAGSAEKYQALLETYVRTGMRRARLQAEIDGTEAVAFASVPREGLDDAAGAAMERAEGEEFASRRDDLAKQRAAMAEAIANAQSRYAILRQSKANLDKETGAYETEAKRVQSLLDKGLTAMNRLTDAQRAVFVVATRALETSAQVAITERELFELKRSLEKVDGDRRLENLTALRETELELSDAKAKMLEGRQRLELSGSYAGAAAPAPAIRIVRQDGVRFVEIAAEKDALLEPGDVVEISMDGPASTATAVPGAVADASVMKKADASIVAETVR